MSLLVRCGFLACVKRLVKGGHGYVYLDDIEGNEDSKGVDLPEVEVEVPCSRSEEDEYKQH